MAPIIDNTCLLLVLRKLPILSGVSVVYREKYKIVLVIMNLPNFFQCTTNSTTTKTGSRTLQFKKECPKSNGL